MRPFSRSRLRTSWILKSPVFMPRTPMARFSKSIKTAISGSSERVRPVALKRWPSWEFGRWEGLFGRKDKRSVRKRQARLAGSRDGNLLALPPLTGLHLPGDGDLFASDLVMRVDLEQPFELIDRLVVPPFPAEGDGNVVVAIDLFRIEGQCPLSVS